MEKIERGRKLNDSSDSQSRLGERENHLRPGERPHVTVFPRPKPGAVFLTQFHEQTEKSSNRSARPEFNRCTRIEKLPAPAEGQQPGKSTYIFRCYLKPAGPCFCRANEQASKQSMESYSKLKSDGTPTGSINTSMHQPPRKRLFGPPGPSRPAPPGGREIPSAKRKKFATRGYN